MRYCLAFSVIMIFSCSVRRTPKTSVFMAKSPCCYAYISMLIHMFGHVKHFFGSPIQLRTPKKVFGGVKRFTTFCKAFYSCPRSSGTTSGSRRGGCGLYLSLQFGRGRPGCQYLLPGALGRGRQHIRGDKYDMVCGSEFL